MSDSIPSSLQLVDIKEMAKILNVPVSWIYQRTRLGQSAVPFVKLGKYLRFNPHEVLKHFKITQKIDESPISETEKNRQKKIAELNRPVVYDVASRLSHDIKKYGSLSAALAKADENFFNGKTMCVEENGEWISVRPEDVRNGRLTEEARKRLNLAKKDGE